MSASSRDGRSHTMRSLYAARAGFPATGHHLKRHRLSKMAIEDLKWWLERLNSPFLGITFRDPGPIHTRWDIMHPSHRCAAGYSRGIQQNDILRRIVNVMQDYHIWLSPTYVNTHNNLQLGTGRRAVFDPRTKLLPYPPSVPYGLEPYVKTRLAIMNCLYGTQSWKKRIKLYRYIQ
ncbi:hypothetical protein CYLTODRAFT_460027 [Cylindrobasidium torrendii FP15055 ss-10]|uniref:Uncharacterized protein n=1 Tax=Cylindrobasidium torrendii FP15055 ss-10 TaxID=1314674 RepID=A0A0D7ASC0_9AGAR|nr:hypothetical protein CYLTODRAFT_460027 [Cylindrobasidium torrendii FP15055 ss-10]